MQLALEQRPARLNEPLWRRYPAAAVTAVLVLLFVALALSSEHFLTWSNLVTTLTQATILAVAGLGMTFVVIGGGLDLSTGSVAALSGMMGALVMKSTGSLHAGVLAVLASGAACGWVNGFLVSRRGVSPFIATLGMMVIARGLALAVTDARPVVGLPPALGNLAYGELLGVPWVVLLTVLLFVIGYIVLHHTTFGIQIFIIGDNAQAGRFAGLRVERIQTLTYVISGLLGAVAGLFLTARLRSGQPTVGMFLELFAVAAVVLGGNSLRGGRGHILYTVLGVLIIAFLQNGMNLLNVNSYYQNIVLAVVLIATAAAELLRRR